MGSLVEYHCPTCRYASGTLRVGWGKAGRAQYWGGVALCASCRAVRCVDLAEGRGERRDRRCPDCGGPVRVLEGLAERVACPYCGATLVAETRGSWS